MADAYLRGEDGGGQGSGAKSPTSRNAEVDNRAPPTEALRIKIEKYRMDIDNYLEKLLKEMR